MTRSYEAQIKAAQRERKRALGLVEKHIWVHPADWPAILKRVREAIKRRVEK